MRAGALAGIRVLELCDEVGQYCGKLLGDMGADVIKVEPPGGERTRRIGPFLDDLPHPERSLHFFHYNTSKRGVTLDLTRPEGQDLFLKLAATADGIVENRGVGVLDGLGLGYHRLRLANPGLVLVAISPFGESGPYRDYRSCDLVAQALGGLSVTSGHPDREPLPIFGGQSYHVVSVMAAQDLLAGLFHRAFHGHGQRIELSMQEAVAFVDEWVAVRYIYPHEVTSRHGAGTGGAFEVVPCRDGHVLLSILDPWEPLAEWIAADGLEPEIADPQWNNRRLRQEHNAKIFGLMARWCLRHTRDEIVEGSRRIRQTFAPVYSPEELLAEPQLAERGFFVDVPHPDLGRSFTYPGAPYQFGDTPWHLSRRAPLIGEHNAEVYAELGLTGQELALLMARGAI